MRTLEGRARALVQRSSAPARPATPSQLVLQREGETWRIALGDRSVVLKDAKGLSYLEALVAAPCREIHARELVGQHPEGDGGPLLDERAKREYRDKVASLREELEEATTSGDLGRAERLRATLDAVAGDERARINVQRRLRDVIGRVRALDPDLGDHLQRSVRTGMFCVYLPVATR
jgi:hypothetical protein